MREDAEIVVNVWYTKFGIRIADCFIGNTLAYTLAQRKSAGKYIFEEERLSWRIRPGDIDMLRECALRALDNSGE